MLRACIFMRVYANVNICAWWCGVNYIESQRAEILEVSFTLLSGDWGTCRAFQRCHTHGLFISAASTRDTCACNSTWTCYLPLDRSPSHLDSPDCNTVYLPSGCQPPQTDTPPAGDWWWFKDSKPVLGEILSARRPSKFKIYNLIWKLVI